MNDFDYRETNRAAWANLASAGSDSSRPWGSDQFADPWAWLDPDGWLPRDEIASVLCVASGGGQQGPLFASLGYRVTVIDLSAEQLERDASVAAAHDLPIECIEGDMLDMSMLHGRDFDLVAQAVSACYVPDVDRLYREVAAVLRPGGWYHVEHWSPLHVQLADEPWDGEAYRISRAQSAGSAVPWQSWDAAHEQLTTCLHFIHPAAKLIGGLCDAGFVICRFGERAVADLRAEPGSHAHLAAFLPPFMSLLARRSTDAVTTRPGRSPGAAR